MSTNDSFQLPGLLSIISSLELRVVNRHCRFATDSSEQFFDSDFGRTTVLSDPELKILRSTKVGLLCALCFPTCDAPQLRILTDFLTLLLYDGIRAYAHDPSKAQAKRLSWDDLTNEDGSGIPRNERSLNLLKNHAFFKHIVSERFAKLMSKAPSSWHTRFENSITAFRSAQEQVIVNRIQNVLPTVKEYIDLRREMYGISMIIDVAELLEVFEYPELGLGFERVEKLLASLQTSAFDLMGWSMDVVSYQIDQSRGNSHNLVALLMAHQNLSVQGAMNLSGNMIKDAFSSFCAVEKSILELMDPKAPSMRLPQILYWMWSTMITQARGESSSEIDIQLTEATNVKIKRYITGIKDCIVGVIHWVYETELFFGKKGGEIRTFGWVFVDQVPPLPV